MSDDDAMVRPELIALDTASRERVLEQSRPRADTANAAAKRTSTSVTPCFLASYFSMRIPTRIWLR
jgi:hypothetical protein